MFGHARHPRALLVLSVFGVVAIAAIVVFESSSPSSQSRSTLNDADQVRADFSTHLDSIHTMNTSAIEQAYEGNATVLFTSPGEQGTGNQTGLQHIRVLFQAYVFPNFALPRFSAINSTVKVSGASAAVDSSFVIAGDNSNASPQSARVVAHTLYVKEGGNWLISYESWSFVIRPGAQR